MIEFRCIVSDFHDPYLGMVNQIHIMREVAKERSLNTLDDPYGSYGSSTFMRRVTRRGAAMSGTTKKAMAHAL